MNARERAFPNLSLSEGVRRKPHRRRGQAGPEWWEQGVAGVASISPEPLNSFVGVFPCYSLVWVTVPVSVMALDLSGESCAAATSLESF